MEQQRFLSDVTLLVNRNQDQEALRLLRDALRRQAIDADGMDKAGRLIAKVHARSAHLVKSDRVLLLGQCTTSWIRNALVAAAWESNLRLDVVEGQYDNVMQELVAYPEEHDLSAVILLPWGGRLFLESRDSSHYEQIDLDEIVAFWQRAWDIVCNRLNARILQIGFDLMTPGALGYHLAAQQHGELHNIRQLNSLLREALPQGSFFVDLEQVSGALGRGCFYDFRRYYWTKQPFSEAGTCLLAMHIAAGLRALVYGPKKVLVLDLDNTLWGGVVGEVGPLGISLGDSPDGEAYRAFQKHVKALSNRGILLAACSKNNPEDALGPFKTNPEMQLRIEDFAHFEVSWEPKEAGLRRIADALSLGLDSFVFFDDNPAEREHIRQALPDVEVVEVPEEPADYIRALQAGLWFESVAISSDDKLRVCHYQQESQRRDMQKSIGSLDDYLRSLDMQAIVSSINETSLQRVVQLIGKTNQFNLTTRRHGTEDVKRLLRLPDAIGRTMNMSDRFGDYGLVAVLIGVPDLEATEKTLHLDTWLMSCRVIGRTAEQFIFNAILDDAMRLGYKHLKGEFIPTSKNMLVADLYDNLGFIRAEVQAESGVIYGLPLTADRRAVTFVHPAE